MGLFELKLGVSRLSEDDLAEFTDWFEEFLAERYDRKGETDVLAGRLG